LTTLHEFLPSFLSIRTAKQELVSAGIVDYWLDLAIREADSESNKTFDVRVSALNFMVDLWLAFPTRLEEKDEIASAVLSALKRGSRERHRLIQHFALSKLFHMLEVFTLDRNPYAPILYKTLTFSLVENYHDSTIRELLMQNFTVTFDRNQSMPVGILVEPLVRQLQVSPDAGFNIFDVDFFISVAKHPRLTVKLAVMILDVLGKTYINDLTFTRATRVPFMMVTSRFIDSEIMHELMGRLLVYLLKIVVAAEVAKDKTEKQLQLRHDAILTLIRAVLSLKNPEVSVKIKGILLDSNAEVKRNTRQNSRPICEILGVFGEAEELVKEHAILNPEVELPPPEPEPILVMSETAEPNPLYESDRRKTAKDTKAYRAPRTPPGRATVDIDKARRRRLEKELKEQILAELKEAEDTRRRQRTKKVVHKRKIIVAIDRKDDDSILIEATRVKTVSLTELSSEEHDAVTNVLRRYGRVLRLLFKKYSSSGYVRTFKSGTFDALAERKTSLAPAEYFKLLKEQGVVTTLLTLEEFDLLLKAYMKETQRSSGVLEFDGYMQMFVQLAIYIFSKPPKDLSYLHPVLSVKSLFDLFRQNAVERGLSTKMYDEPDPGVGDRDIVLKLNSLLEADPEASIPEGYRRVTEKELYVEHTVPSALKLKESQTVAITLMDELLNRLFGVHILEPTVGFNSVSRVKGTLARRGQHQGSRTSFDTVSQVPGFQQLSPVVKFETVKLQGSLPADALFEVAKTLDEMIHSLEQGSSVLVNRSSSQAQVFNKVLKQKVIEDEQDKLEQARRERRRKLRKQLVEKRLKREKESKDHQVQEDIEEKKRLKEQDKELKAKLENRRRKQRQERDKVLQEWKQKKEADDKQKSEAENKKLSEDFAKKQHLRDNFRKKESKKVKQLLADRQQKHVEDKQAEADRARQAEEQKVRDRKVFRAKQKAARSQREQERKAKADIASQLSEAPIVAIWDEFGASVDVVFKHFCRLSAAGNSEVLNSGVLPFPGYNKFCTMFKVWPSLVAADDSMQVFRLLTKDRLSDSKIPISLSRSNFNEALLRLALKSKRALGLPPETPSEQTLRSFLDWLNVTSDPKKTVDVMRLMTSQQPLDAVLGSKKMSRSSSKRLR
jgi:hypothetical protein